MGHAFSRALRPTSLLAAVIIAALVAVADTYRSISHTWDEPAHLANGLMLLDTGKYIEYQHPPLARLAMAVGPYLAGERSAPPAVLPARFVDRVLQSFDEGRRVLYSSGAYDRVLTLARLGILPFFVLLLIVTYVWTRWLLDEWTALLAAVFVATTPIVLGNAGIATLDLPLTALAITSLWLFCRWLERPTPGSAVALGAATGAAIMSKLSAIPFLGLGFAAIGLTYVLSLVRRWPDALSLRPRVKGAAVAGATAFVVGWLSFGGGFVSIADPAKRPYGIVDDLFSPGTVNRVVSDALEVPVVPYFLWALKEGVEDVSYHNKIGHTTYLLGERGERGFWNYYLVGLAVRTPLPLLLAGMVGLALLVRASRQSSDWRLAVPAVVFVAVLIFVSVYSQINLGIRHILLLYPLLAIGAACATMHLLKASRHRAVAVGVAGAVLAAQCTSAVLAHPDHVAYFNIVAGSQPERFLIMADLDWGQDMKYLEAELRARRIDKIGISFNGSNDLSRHDLPPYTVLQPNTPQTGWIAISIWRLHRNDDFAWLRSHTPVARIGSSVNLYFVEDETPSEARE